MVELRNGYAKLLLIDDREPLSFCEKIAENCSIPIEFRRMKTGDYVCEDVAIERKTIKDFASSMISKKKRLWNQYDRLRTEFAWPYIVISGKTTELESEVSDHAIIGAIAYLTTPKLEGNPPILKQVPVIKVDTDNQLAYLILKILERHKKLRLPSELYHI